MLLTLPSSTTLKKATTTIKWFYRAKDRSRIMLRQSSLRTRGEEEQNSSATLQSRPFPGNESVKTKNPHLAVKMFSGRRELTPVKPFFNVVRSTRTSSMENDALFERWKQRRQLSARNSRVR